MCLHSDQGLIQKLFQQKQLLLRQIDAALHGCGNADGSLLESFACLRKRKKQLSLVVLRPYSIDISLLLKAFEQRGEGAGVEVHNFAQLTLRHPTMFPENHHDNILRVCKIQFFQRLPILPYDLLGAGIQRKAKLVSKADAVIFICRF